MKKSKVSLFFLRFPGTNPRFALRCYAGQRAALLLLFSSEQQHFQCYQSLNKVPARFKPSSLFVLYVCFWRSCALTSRTLSRFFFFFNYRNGFSLRVVYLCRAGPVFVPVFFLCIWKAEAQQLFQPAQPRSCTACLIPQKTFGTLHNQHISSSISTNLCILLGRAAGFCRLVRAAEKVKRIPHNSVYFPRAWPIKGLHFCRFHKVLVKFS